MARKTKKMLEQEVVALRNEIEELHKRIGQLNYDKYYWFLKYERFNIMDITERSKNQKFLNEERRALFHESLKEIEAEKLARLKVKETQFLNMLGEKKRYETMDGLESFLNYSM
ncbi:hypothetical protein OCB06_15170 [Bacillus cereus]|nr:hypothetical protein [Bacillus cereus]